MQSGRDLSKFEPKALYNLQDNPGEKPKGNFINDANYKDRITAMQSEYVEIVKSQMPTVPQLVDSEVKSVK